MRKRLIAVLIAAVGAGAIGATVWAVGGFGSTTSADPVCSSVPTLKSQMLAALQQPPPIASNHLRDVRQSTVFLAEKAVNANVKTALTTTADDLALMSKFKGSPTKSSQDWQALEHACGS
jgi:hypothetical protein